MDKQTIIEEVKLHETMTNRALSSMDEEIKSNYSNFEQKNQIRIEDYYFGRPERNQYTNEELFEMPIEEIIFGIHPTVYGKNYEKSFHPFFYLKLHNEDIEDFGVVVQYIFVPEDTKEEQLHLYEKDGIEFIEKVFDDFDRELKLIFYRATEDNILNLSKWVISYKSFDIARMTLGQFFQIAIPKKGEYLQNYLKNLKKTCIEFCIKTIVRLNLPKKKAKAIEPIKSNMQKALKLAKDSKNYKKYEEGFNALFNLITE